MNRIPLYAIFMLVAAQTSCVNTEVRKQNEAAIPDSMRSYVIGEYVVTCKPHNENCNQQFNSPMSNPTHSTPSISVALCTFNAARYLREQLNSV